MGILTLSDMREENAVKNRPGISWGPDDPVNLMRTSKGWAAVCYKHDKDPGEIIRLFKPRTYYDHEQMMRQCTLWNYGTCELCPIVRIEMDYDS